MKRLEGIQSLSEKLIAPFYINGALTDNDILFLQDSFLTNGYHYIKVPDIQTGRSLINTFLASLNCYHTIACLTLHNDSLHSDIIDMYHALLINNYINNQLEDFFVDDFHCDFMWIELTKALEQYSWFEEFRKLLQEFKIEKNIPIIITQYDSIH